MFLGSPRTLFAATAMIGLIGGFSPSNAQCSPDPWADLVIDASPTAGIETSVLGAPDGVLADFEEVSGMPGFVTVAFVDDVIVDGPGDDFIVHVADFAASEVVESFELFVSDGGSLYTSLGPVFPTSPFQNQPEELRFDLNGSGVAEVRQIMIMGLNADFLHLGEGVDVDAFQAVNCSTPVDTDMQECLDALDACSDESIRCESELEAANLGWGACMEDLDQSRAELDEGQAGLAEIRRLLSLPPGHRESGFTCEGELCPAMLEAIGMLTSPPGRNRRHGRR